MLNQNSKILIVDDTEMAPFVLRKRLPILYEMPPENIHWAKSGEEALTLLQTKCYDLLCTDMEMAQIKEGQKIGMNGDELIARLLQDASLDHMPVILISGNKYIAANPYGADASLKKGDWHELPEVIERAYSHAAQRRVASIPVSTLEAHPQ
ncbi:MAG: response regulator [Alphaproteobacteria bacterium]|jgi:CheY-like chemotaxis protein|nr:response regulator [Alphaproteobacteria bacterium]